MLRMHQLHLVHLMLLSHRQMLSQQLYNSKEHLIVLIDEEHY